ncbi:hypothetical protein [Aureimonas mangrovi]|uniref:hypothetical protein n=1 Tax=Aureimonas mangrovi TaxID=2758041 RepID=UPI00163D6E44|nr:hypothetical protein [Aureimonas mangrovi]
MNIDAATLVANAQARKAALAAANAPTARRKAAPGPVTAEDAVVRRLSDDMIDIAAAKGCAEEVDLLNRGHSLAALRKYGDRAREIANRAVVRRVA